MKKKKEKMPFKVHIFMIVTVFFCVIELIVLFTFWIHPASVKNVAMSGEFTVASNWEMENSVIVKDVVDFCRPFGVQEDIVECVVTNVGKHYNYTSRNDDGRSFLLVDDFETQGYMCRDIAVAYNAIFRTLGFQVNYVFSKNHVYNSVYYIGEEYLDCIINMDKYICWS